MGIRAILPLAPIMLIAGQLAAGAITLDERLGTPVHDGARQLPQEPPKTITPIHGNSVLSISCVLVYIPSSSTCTPSSFTGDHEGSAADVKEDKGFVPPRGYFHAPTLPPCHRKACCGGRLRLHP